MDFSTARPEISKESVESNYKDKTTDLPNSDDITEKPVATKAAPRQSKRTKTPKRSVKSCDWEIVTGFPIRLTTQRSLTPLEFL